jgi:hypothetical protein
LLDGHPEATLTRASGLSTEWCRLTGVALSQHDLGHSREAQEALDQLVATHAEDSAYQVAQVYSRRREKARAFHWLERAYAQRDVGLRNVKSDPLLHTLHGDPRFTALLKKMNLPTD